MAFVTDLAVESEQLYIPMQSKKTLTALLPNFWAHDQLLNWSAQKLGEHGSLIPKVGGAAADSAPPVPTPLRAIE